MRRIQDLQSARRHWSAFGAKPPQPELFDFSVAPATTSLPPSGRSTSSSSLARGSRPPGGDHPDRARGRSDDPQDGQPAAGEQADPVRPRGPIASPARSTMSSTTSRRSRSSSPSSTSRRRWSRLNSSPECFATRAGHCRPPSTASTVSNGVNERLGEIREAEKRATGSTGRRWRRCSTARSTRCSSSAGRTSTPPLEEGIDRCRTAGNSIESIVVKHS